MFLCGRSIPEHIKNLPQTVLQTPFGQMLRPALERQLRPITAAPPSMQAQFVSNPSQRRLEVASSYAELERLLKSAESKCVIAFFTSATCPPCRVIYPHFEELAEEAGEKAVFVKVDVGVAHDIGAKYHITATPTFITWSKGEKLDSWSGASVADLKSFVRMMYMATYPGREIYSSMNFY